MNPFIADAPTRRISSIDLAWQQRFSGLLAITRHGVMPDGRVMLVRQDELAARTYQLIAVEPGGGGKVLSSLSVETLKSAELASDGALMVAVTDNSLYLFRDGKKQRLMPDVRARFAFVSLSREGSQMAVASSDMLFSRFALSLCEISGRELWEMDFESPVTALGISPAGDSVAVGIEDGTALGYDANRNQIWRFTNQGSVTALAALPSGGALIAASPSLLSALDNLGDLQWAYHTNGEIISVACADDASVIALASRREDGTVGLACLDHRGSLVWEYSIEESTCALAASPDGSFLAVVGGSGLVQCFGIRLGEIGEVSSESAFCHLNTAKEALAARDSDRALCELETALRLNPADLDACDMLKQLRTQCVAERLAVAKDLASSDPAKAYDNARSALELEPLNAETISMTRALRDALLTKLTSDADAAANSGESVASLSFLMEALELDFTCREIREKIREANRRIASNLTASADALASEGKLANAIRQMESALGYHPDDQSAVILKEYKAKDAFQAGLELYNAKRYPEAIYQFKKALNLKPGYADADRYLRYAEKFGADADISERFTKLE